VLGASSGPPTAQNRPPIETTKVKGADNVHIFRNVNHQSMFIVTSDGVIATDPIAYGRPTGGQTYVDEIRKVIDKPIKYEEHRRPSAAVLRREERRRRASAMRVCARPSRRACPRESGEWNQAPCVHPSFETRARLGRARSSG
jgi:hypothetical protein